MILPKVTSRSSVCVLLLCAMCAIFGCSHSIDKQTQEQYKKQTLFRIYENNKFGYIDTTGKVIIKPKFHNAGDFSEGLAAVREDGLYGYINEQGEYVIQPEFEYASKFNEGCAVVYTNAGKPSMVDMRGKTVIPTGYAVMYAMQYGRVRVCTYSNKEGLIDRNGELIIDTIFHRITRLNNMYIVEKTIIDTGDNIDRSDNLLRGLRNIMGEEIIPVSNYEYIREARNEGFYLGDIRSAGNHQIGEHVFDAHGKMVYYTSDPKNFDSERFKEKSRYKEETPLYKIFAEGKRFGVKDSKGRVVLKPIFEGIKYIENDNVYFTIERIDSSGMYAGEYTGIVSMNGDTIQKPEIEEIDYKQRHRTLMLCKIKNRTCYLNHSGRLIWTEGGSNTVATTTNIDRIAIGQHYVDSEEFSIFSTSTPIISEQQYSTKSECTSVVSTETVENKMNSTLCYKMVLMNNTAFPIKFSTYMSRIAFTIQAKNPAGVWVDLETQDNSGCGNCAGSVILKKGEKWEVLIPQYQGSYSTTMRLQAKGYVKVKDSEGQEKFRDVIVNSNEYSGSVNPGQFWRDVENNYYEDNRAYRKLSQED